MPEETDQIFILEQGKIKSLPLRPMRLGLLGKSLEDFLQSLFEQYPSIIPGAQIDPASEDPPRFVLLRREMPVGRWSLDHLYVDQFGVLTLLETKPYPESGFTSRRYRPNRRIRRKCKRRMGAWNGKATRI